MYQVKSRLSFQMVEHNTISRSHSYLDSGIFSTIDNKTSLNVFYSIEMLAEKLNMNINDAERWIVNLIKNARLDAKIDSKRGHVVMSDQATNPHQQVIDKTKNLQVIQINTFHFRKLKIFSTI